jgi:HAD superfamily hydrolase (TIGR01490 family)
VTRTAAFFDLDRTLIRGSANFPLAVAAFRAGYVPPRDLLRDAVSAVRFIARGATDEASAALRERILRAVAGHPAEDVIALGAAFIPKLAGSVLPEARAALERHAAAGEDRIIVSASPIEIVSALATELGLEGAVGTRSEIVDGRYTGRLDGAFCYRDGKVVEVQRLAAERGYDLSGCTAYSDSISDLPFLQAVGNPVAINADKELLAHARQQGWPVIAVTKPRLRKAAARPNAVGVPA